ncbi:MAG: plasmid stabilization protein ParE [Erythrobacter sp.]|nr:plasmid stabilization protein ParE [Erythrobacter sp.]
MKYTLRPAARADLAEIWLFGAAQWDVPQADEYLAMITSRIETVAEMPGIGSPAEDLPSRYRKLAAGAHRVIYRAEDDAVIVVRVLHERQDVPDEIEEA